MIPKPHTALPTRMTFSPPCENPIRIQPTAVIRVKREMHLLRPNRFAKIPHKMAPNIWEKLMMLAANKDKK